MTWHGWWIFFVAVFLLCGTPGPNMLHVMTRSARFGIRRSLPAMAGCLLAVVLAISASAAGLAALLAAWPRLFDVLRYGGVAYLLYLGAQAFRTSDAPIDVAPDKLEPALGPPRMFRGGLLIGLSNPKLLLFAAAFFPQFINRGAPEGPQFLILAATFATCEAFWYAVYGLGGHGLQRQLRRPALARWFNRLTGGIFIGFGAALLGLRA